MTAIDRYIFRQLIMRLVPQGTAVFLVMMLERTLRLIQEMTVTGMHLRHLPVLMGELVPYYVNLALPGAFALTLVVGVLALASNREIEAMAGFGLSLRQIARPMVALGCVVAGASLLLGGWLEPLGRYDYRVERAIARNSSAIASYAAPAILRLGENGVFSADRQNGQGLSGLFLQMHDANAGETVITSRQGSIATDVRADRLEFTFHRGQALSTGANGQDARLMQFGRLVLQQPLVGSTPVRARGQDAGELTLAELFGQPPSGAAAVPWHERQAAALARLARALSIPFLPLLVLPLLLGAPPGQRWPNLVLIAASFMLFHHGINLAKNLGSAGAMHPALALALVVAPFVALVSCIWILGRGLPGPRRLALGLPFGLKPGLWLAGIAARVPAFPAIASGMTAYLQRHVWAGCLAALAVLVSLLLLVELIEQGEELIRLGAGFEGTARFMAYRLPVLIQQQIPVATLAGALFVFLALRDSRELLAIQLNGISAFGILWRTAPVALSLGLIGLLLSEKVLPVSQTAFANWWQELQQQSSPPTADRAVWFRVDDEIVRVDAIAPDGSELLSPTLYRRDRQAMLSAVVTAQRATREPEQWLLHDVTMVSLAEGICHRSDAQEMPWRMPLEPQGARRLAVNFPALSAREARDALLGGVTTSFGGPFYRTRAVDMPMQPLVPLVMLVLAMPIIFSAYHYRHSVWTVYLAAVAGLLFLAVDGCLKIAGHLGLVPAWQAVWSAPVLFLLASMAWLLRSEAAR